MQISPNLRLFVYHIRDLGVSGLSEVQFTDENLKRDIETKKASIGAKEIFYLATCNRICFLVLYKDFPKQQKTRADFPKAQVYTGFFQSAKKLIEISVSRDSMVFGENQILGQVKKAFQLGQEWKTFDKEFQLILRWVIEESKKIRESLNFQVFPSSVSEVLARKIIDLYNQDQKIVLFGTGETNQILAKLLLKRGYDRIFWQSSSVNRAQEMADNFGGQAIEKLNEVPREAVLCFATDRKIDIDAGFVDATKPRMIADMSMPAAFDHQLAKQFDVILENLEDFEFQLKEQNQVSQKFIDELDREVEISSLKIRDQYILRKQDNIICEHLDHMNDIFQKNFQNKLPKELNQLDEKQKEALEKWAKSFYKEMTHHHIQDVKSLLNEMNQC